MMDEVIENMDCVYCERVVRERQEALNAIDVTGGSTGFVRQVRLFITIFFSKLGPTRFF